MDRSSIITACSVTKAQSLTLPGMAIPLPIPHHRHPRPNTHAHTHTHPTFQQEDFFWGRRQGKIQEVKGNPYLSISSSLRHKKSRKHQLLPCLYFFFPSRKEADMIKAMFLNETKKASNVICGPFITVPG